MQGPFPITRPSNLLRALLVVALFWAAPAGAEVASHYLYRLSNFGGPIPSTLARITVDEVHQEIYLIDEQEVRVFDENGMEIYRFGEDQRLGRISDVAIDMAGNILVLTRLRGETTILRCDFRGQPKARFSLTDLPREFSDFVPLRMCFSQGRLYFADVDHLKMIITDPNGRFERGFDVGAMIGVEEEKRIVSRISGFSIDGRGNMLFTIPVFFAAYVLTPEGELKGHVRPGSGDGKFNMVAGIVADEQGYFYIADRLKDAVLIFDPEFRFLRQFGYRGKRPGSLFGPKDLALDGRGRLYVSQVHGKGVSVFKLSHTEP